MIILSKIYHYYHYYVKVIEVVTVNKITACNNNIIVTKIDPIMSKYFMPFCSISPIFTRVKEYPTTRSGVEYFFTKGE